MENWRMQRNPNDDPRAPEYINQPRPIFFYSKNEPYYEFTNFSDHYIKYEGHHYKTSEHLFQSLKFLDNRPDIAKDIRRANTARQAFHIAHANKQYQRFDWFRINIAMMDLVLLLKFRQHPELKIKLLDTGCAELIENSPSDSFWGNGANRRGRNELGKALMRLRVKFELGFED